MYDEARSNFFGAWQFMSTTLARLDSDTFKRNSTTYETMFLEIYNNDANFNKFIIGSVYRRPSDLTQFIKEFSLTPHDIHAISKEAYINGDFNIDLLQLHTNTHYNTFYDKHYSARVFHKKYQAYSISWKLTYFD